MTLILTAVVSTTAMGQASGTLDVAGTVVEYDGFLTSGAGTFAPTFRFDAGNASFGAQGTWVTFESGNQVLNGTVAAAWISPGTGWRAEVAGAIGASSYSGSDSFGHALVRTRIHYQAQGSGFWAGLASGASAAADLEVPFETSLGAWRVWGQTALVSNATISSLAGEQYFDISVALRWTSNRAQLDALVGGRPASSASGNVAGDAATEAYADLSIVYDITSRIAASMSAGRSRGDPIRNTLASSYVSLGVRLNVFNPPPGIIPIIATAVARTAGTVRESADGSIARLQVETKAGTSLLRLFIPGARTVEIMADFTDWEPVALARRTSDRWELQLTITPGAHRLNVRVDGGPWLVPLGTRLEQSEFGGAAGVIVIR